MGKKADLRTLVVLKNGSAVSQYVDEVGTDGEFIFLNRNGKTVALFQADRVAAVIDGVEDKDDSDFAFKTIVGNEAMQSWADAIQEEILKNAKVTPLADLIQNRSSE